MMREKVSIAAIVTAFVVLIGGLMILVASDYEKWSTWCEEQGGRVIKDTDISTGVGYAPGTGDHPGGPVVVVTFSTDYYCISEDGRILDIR